MFNTATLHLQKIVRLITDDDRRYRELIQDFVERCQAVELPSDQCRENSKSLWVLQTTKDGLKNLNEKITSSQKVLKMLWIRVHV